MKTILFAISVALSAFLVLPAQAAKVSPTEISGAVTVDAAQAKELFDRGVIFVDVRKNSDWDAGRIPGAKHIELKKKYNEASLGKVIAKGKEVVIYCNGAGCMRSSKASIKAVSWGFTKVYYFRGGLPAWQIAGFPVE
ncbi:MAG: rhodanese-like domain-containing protein [Rhodospirillaceae bacterium]|nr:rhodanese-like domain-containing protein [Rhodospirillaceae bacterium]MBT3780837.1 rhodanese-like domain-containing protein [Rhodospirillaceae bacterium]MBT4168137.1 rhodanese-like domain-containing protein [Rhodospirillaceae bacterium]MBT4563406.1 rhodanese-like domain-containing protein [Rhodospirillaceae bacterium]MBT4742728.1 rhodanese-like domain-containing protein [Rhodospirillaceae bacterium]